jgi:membrane peptidoglycan carboxypeptidase
MGISTQLDTSLAAAIGVSNVTMHDQVEAYGVFANQGRRVPLMDITRIDNSAGVPLFEQAPGTQPRQQIVLTPAQSYLITDVLKDYQGQWNLGWNRRMASKSGTTGGAQTGVHPDAWMMAYNPNVVVGAWAGNTGPNGQGHPTSAFGVNVGQTVSARFINGLPRDFTAWYSRPSGLVQGRTGDLFLPGTQSTSCGSGHGEGDNNDGGGDNHNRGHG